MTQRIWKYTLTTTSTKPADNTIEMPIGAKILSVQAQMGEICIWALEEDARATDLVSRRFRVFGTGHTIGGNALTYLGTVQLLEGRLVLHVFEDAHGQALEACPIVEPLERFMSDKSEWAGTATDLLAALEDKTTERQQARPGWPKDGTRLSGQLRRIAPNLRSRGLDIKTSRESGGQRKRIITIAKVAS